MKYLSFATIVLVMLIVLASCNAMDSSKETGAFIQDAPEQVVQADFPAQSGAETKGVDYGAVDRMLADITFEMNQPNILESDIRRGWYLGGQKEKKYGTPDTWIFVENGGDSKWMSPNAMDEGGIIDDRELCRETAGTYYPSCLESSDPDCEYVEVSYCDCLPGSKWKGEQGCILITARGSFVSVNNAELGQGWYFGLPNEKKLNTPSDWIWLEQGRDSVWRQAH